MWGVIVWIVLGGLAGWVASMIQKTNAQMGVVANVVVGIIGAFVGGLIFSLFGGEGVTGFNLYSFVVALIGAIIVLWIVKLFRHSSTEV